MKASLLVSEEASLTALFIVWLKSLNCCPKTSRLILLATTQNTTTENMSTAVSHFKTLRSASTNRRFSILLLTFDTDDSGLSTVYRFWLWSADDSFRSCLFFEPFWILSHNCLLCNTTLDQRFQYSIFLCMYPPCYVWDDLSWFPFKKI